MTISDVTRAGLQRIGENIGLIQIVAVLFLGIMFMWDQWKTKIPPMQVICMATVSALSALVIVDYVFRKRKRRRYFGGR